MAGELPSKEVLRLGWGQWASFCTAGMEDRQWSQTLEENVVLHHSYRVLPGPGP